jgi:hypothetical protein
MYGRDMTTTNTRRVIEALAIASASVLANVPAPANASPSHYCVDDDHMCKPGNSEGKPAACYDDGGVIVAEWPCYAVIRPDGSFDILEGIDPLTLEAEPDLPIHPTGYRTDPAYTCPDESGTVQIYTTYRPCPRWDFLPKRSTDNGSDEATR